MTTSSTGELDGTEETGSGSEESQAGRGSLPSLVPVQSACRPS